jgi:hypothetical protein
MIGDTIFIYLGTFLLGFVIGIAPKFAGDWLTDRRREWETKSKGIKDFIDITGKMPDLIEEMKKDLEDTNDRIIREFFILPNRRVSLWRTHDCFTYYEDEIPELQNKIHILEDHGYIVDVTPGNAPMYRMKENFVKYLLNNQ